MSTKTPVTLHFDDDQLARLAVLDRDQSGSELERAMRALTHLAHSAIDGVRRPGAWERQWLCQAFSSDFESRLEQDADCAFWQRPRKDDVPW